MLSLRGRLTLGDLFEQAWNQVQQSVLEQLKRTIEGLLGAERDRWVAEARQRGEKVYRWGYTVRKCWTTLWGTLEQIRVPRLRGQVEIGLLEKHQRHTLGEVLFALTVGGLSQRKRSKDSTPTSRERATPRAERISFIGGTRSISARHLSRAPTRGPT